MADHNKYQGENTQVIKGVTLLTFQVAECKYGKMTYIWELQHNLQCMT